MNIEAIAVTSSDGFIADIHGDTSRLHSQEDSKLFEEVKSKFPLLVMGRKTYESVKGVLKLSPDLLRVVLTHCPQDYASETVPNVLTFSSAEPHELKTRMEHQGFTSMLVVGGSQVYSEFIRAGLLNRFHITTEPVTLGNGIPLTNATEFLKNTKLIKHTLLNERKTSYTLYEYNS